MSNNNLYCSKCKTQHHPVECPKEEEDKMNTKKKAILIPTEHPEMSDHMVDALRYAMFLFKPKLSLWQKLIKWLRSPK